MADPAVLERLSKAERIRLETAAGDVFEPDVEIRRRRVRDRKRRERDEKRDRDQAALDETGIRTLRAKPVFTTPNVFPPEHFVQTDVTTEVANGEGANGVDANGEDATDREERAVGDRVHCYVCKRKYTEIHHFYDQLCPECAAFNFAKRTETADLAGGWRYSPADG